MSKIRPDELDARLDEDGPFVLDIRPKGDYQTGHIEGSHNVPVYDALRAGDEEALRRHLDEIPRDREIVTVCKQGIIAKRATNVLAEEGYDASTLAGGMGGWRGYQNETLGYRLRSLLWRLL